MQRPKNVLFLLVDQWPAHSFGFMGSSCKTPNLDDLAAKSTVFTNAFTTCPLCTPARGALLTGRWPHETGVYDNCGVGYSNQPGLSDSVPTWLDHAIVKGYRVGYHGKWHLGTDGLKNRGLHSYDDPGEVLLPYSQRPDFSYETAKAHGESTADTLVRGTPMFWGEMPVDEADTRCARTVDAGIAFLERYQREQPPQPFFLTISISDPHFPHYLPSSFVAGRESLNLEFPKNFYDNFRHKPAFQSQNWWPCHDTARLSEEEWKHIFDFALWHREFVDAHLGRVLRYLDDTGLADDTMVVFTSDHGDMCGAHNRFDKGPYFYDEVWRIPLMVSVPEVQACRNAEFVSLIEVGRFFNRYFGASHEPNGDIQIENELGVDKVQPQMNDSVLGIYDAYNGHWFGIRAIRNPRYKYVRNYNDMDEFYDLVQDPHELINLIDNPSYQTQIHEMADRLDSYLARINDPIARVDSLPKPGELIYTVQYKTGT